MGQAHEPGGAVEGRPEVVAVALVRLTHMQAHAHPELEAHRPTFPLQGPLRVERRCKRVPRGPESTGERVPGSGEHHPAVRIDGFPQDRIVTLESLSHHVRVPFPKPG